MPTSRHSSARHGTMHTDTLRPHALLDTPTATIPPHPSLPWHEASVWTSKAWDEVSYNRRRVDRWDRPSHRRTDGRTLDRFITHTAYYADRETRQCCTADFVPGTRTMNTSCLGDPVVCDTTQPIRCTRGVIIRYNGVDTPSYGLLCANMATLLHSTCIWRSRLQ